MKTRPLTTTRVTTRRALTVTVGVAVATVVGVAVALWTQEGRGDGSAKALDPKVSVVTVGVATNDELYPGFTGGDLYFKITNPNPYPVQFTKITGGPAADQTGCPGLNVTVPEKTVAIDVDAGATTAVDRTVLDVVTMHVAAPDGCKGKTFTIPVTLTGTQK